MKKTLLASAILLLLVSIVLANPENQTDKPQYNKAGELFRPENYREWVSFLLALA